MALPSDTSSVDIVEKFQSLQAGQYWKSKKAIDPGIQEGMVLLLQSIRWVDDKPHTIILRPHPSVIGQRFWVPMDENEPDKGKRGINLTEHRFLLDKFLESFDFEPDHELVRSAELQAVQAKINDLQNELLQSQTNPSLLAAVVEEELAKEETVQLPSLSMNQAANIVSSGVMSAIGTGITEAGIASIKVAADRELKVAQIKSQWIQSKTKMIAETISEMTPYYEEQAAAVLAHTEDVQAYVKKLKSGVESLDLYVGKDVTVFNVASGESAPKDVPLTFVQKKLLVDEELAVYLEVDAWFDFKDMGKFQQALRDYPDLVNQIFPTERCVLVMATTRRKIDYGHPLASVIQNKENQEVFLMVRDGENIHQVWSPVESHLSASRLFPSKGDQDRLFNGVDGSTIKFEDIAYTDALKDHELHALHYKRFLILAAGLDHRLKLFGDFYEGPESLNFVSMEFQEKYCRFLHDDDGAGMLPNADKRPPFREWMNARNKIVKSGSRLIGRWSYLVDPDNAPSMFSRSNFRGEHERYYFPVNNTSVAIAYTSGSELFVDIPVSGRGPKGHREFNAKVRISEDELSGRSRRMDEGFNLLCLDDVDPDDIDYYIQSRPNRSNFLEYVSFFKKLRDFLKEELATQAETRQFLLKSLTDANIGRPENRKSIVNLTVSAWRAEHRGKELPVIGDMDPKDIKALLDHMYAVANSESFDTAAIDSMLKSKGYDTLRIALNGNGKLVAYAKPNEDQIDYVLEKNPFVNRIMLERKKNGDFDIKSTSLALMPVGSASEKTLFETEDAKEYAGKTSVFGTHSAKMRFLRTFEDSKALLERYTRKLDDNEFDFEFKTWQIQRRSLNMFSKRVQNPSIQIPVGGSCYRYDERNHVDIIYLTLPTHVFLHLQAPDDKCRMLIKDEFVRTYQNKEHAARHYESNVNVEPHRIWSSLIYCQFGKKIEDATLSGSEVKEKENYLYTDFIEKYLGKNQSKVALSRGEHSTKYVDPSLFIGEKFILDVKLGIELPADWKLHNVQYVTYRPSSEEKEVSIIVGDYVKPSERPKTQEELWTGHEYSRPMRKLIASMDERFKKDQFYYSGRKNIAVSDEDLNNMIRKEGLDPDQFTLSELEVEGEYDFDTQTTGPGSTIQVRVYREKLPKADLTP